jgi:sec-independent protein translocase protein TatB
MFDVGWTELLVIAAVAIVVIGPKDLPKAMRAVGQWSTRIKGMARDFQGQFNEALREAELDDIDKDFRAVGSVRGFRAVDEEVSKTSNEIRRVLDRPAEVARAEKAEKATVAAAGTDAKPAAAPVDQRGAVKTEVKPATAPAPAKPAASAPAPATNPPAVAVAAGDSKP